MTVRECLKKAYKETNTEDAVTDCGILMSYLLNTERSSLVNKYYDILPEEKESEYFLMIQRLNKGEPVQYITGQASFGELVFNVNENVLIPRSDTEILYETALEVLKNKELPCSCLDLCTGSGCVVVSLAHKSEKCDFYASDISPEALSTAQENSQKYNLDSKITFILSDLFENMTGKMFDIIVSNPPYIPTEDIKGLDSKVKDYEPYLALNGGNDGLDVYRRIIHDSLCHLKPGGILMMEMGIGEENDLRVMMEKSGYKKITVIKDYGQIPRVIYGTV